MLLENFIDSKGTRDAAPEIISITVRDHTTESLPKTNEAHQRSCVACCDESETCLDSDCLCYDLHMCETCWEEWIINENYFLQPNEEDATSMQKNYDLVCKKCNTRAFCATVDNENNFQKKSHFFSIFLLTIFTCVGCALVIFANVTLVNEKKLKNDNESNSNKVYFLFVINFVTCLFLYLLVRHLKKTFNAEEFYAEFYTLTCKTGSIKNINI